jgi:AbrB family looped-hinge helix DNA binding protein
MKTRVSTKGQVVIPHAVRERLHLRPGDALDTHLEGDRIVLVPTRRGLRRGRLTRSQRTGLPLLNAGPDAPRITSKQVAEILADFP